MLKLARDFFSDGYKIIGVIAPLASLTFTICKFYGVQLMGLHTLSYAWALLPLLIWVSAAYIRRHAAFQVLARQLETPDFQTQQIRALEEHAREIRLQREEQERNNDPLRKIMNERIERKYRAVLLPPEIAE